MKRDLWAVVCGNIRDELDFKLTVSKLIQLRNDQKIQHIVLSTWRGEINKYDGLRDNLKLFGIHIIESWEIDKGLENAPTLSTNYWRQARQMLAAMEIIPRNAFILKARTDRSLNYLNQIEKLNLFDKFEIEPPKAGNFPILFQYKISVFSPKMVRILHMIDFVFLGYWRDIYKLINFEVGELGSRKMVVANLQWFYKPFVNEFPLLRSYYQFTIYNNTIKTLRDYVDKYGNEAKFPKIYYKIYAIYFLILYTHFNIVSGSDLKEEDSVLSFYHCFTTSPKRNMVYTTLGNSIKNNDVVAKFINGDFFKDDSYEYLTKYIKELIKDGVNETFDLTCLDYMELMKFDKENIFEKNNVNCLKYLRNPPLAIGSISRKYNNIEPLVFKCLGVDDSVWVDLYHTKSLENDLLNKWLLTSSEIDNFTTVKMLLPSAKVGNEKTIYILLDMLNNDLIDSLNEIEIIRVAKFYIDLLIQRNKTTLMTKRNFLQLIVLALKKDVSDFNFIGNFKILFNDEIRKYDFDDKGIETLKDLFDSLECFFSNSDESGDNDIFLSDLGFQSRNGLVLRKIIKEIDKIDRVLIEKKYLLNKV